MTHIYDQFFDDCQKGYRRATERDFICWIESRHPDLKSVAGALWEASPWHY